MKFFYVITIFPKAFDSFLQTSLIARGIKKKILAVNVYDLRTWTKDRHKTVDGRPYGGGPGMVLRADVMERAISNTKAKISKKNRIILLDPAGKQFNQKMAKRLAKFDELILIAGHYEGYDERIRSLVDEEISIGDYIVTGGELPAMVVIDAIARNIKGFLGKEASLEEESFGFRNSNLGFLLEYPQYTRPEVFKKRKVPAVLMTGNHADIGQWRLKEALKRTMKRRPDLLDSVDN